MTAPRWIDLDGVRNMRDIGGLPTADGRETKPGRLLRSDNLQTLTARDVERLTDELGVTDIVDLRSDVELHLEGPGPLMHATALTHHHHSLFRDERVDDAERAHETTRQALALPWTQDSSAPETEPTEPTEPIERAESTAREPDVDEDFWASHYLGYLAGRPDSVSAALHAVATSSGAVVVHCAAGKDRTGTVIGLALAVAGVSRAEIVADYVATSERLEAVLGHLSQRPAYADHLRDQPIEEQLPRAASMERLLEVLDAEFGGAAGWLRGQGWSGDEVAALRAKLLD
ncbi:MAG TPA: tyrosine-protein phosphatase [Dermatophilaceae bacterium]|jgi:protein tyrosine/serine phosphatase|nr:tyrosine-protein phosphatase [Dermatophilaceae bacterium]